MVTSCKKWTKLVAKTLLPSHRQITLSFNNGGNENALHCFQFTINNLPRSVCYRCQMVAKWKTKSFLQLNDILHTLLRVSYVPRIKICSMDNSKRGGCCNVNVRWKRGTHPTYTSAMEPVINVTVVQRVRCGGSRICNRGAEGGCGTPRHLSPGVKILHFCRIVHFGAFRTVNSTY